MHPEAHLVSQQFSTRCLNPQSEQFPQSLDELFNAQSLGGGTRSTYKVEDAAGHTYVLKYGAHQEQMQIEILMNVLYRRLGVKVRDIEAYMGLPSELAHAIELIDNTATVQLAEYIEGSKLSDADKECIKQQARGDFIIHAFLGNIDIAKCDNYLMQANEVLLIDAGANFIFRAQGEPREENAVLLSEIDSMRDAELNRQAHEWFGDLDGEEINAQVADLIEMRDLIEETIWQVSQQLGFSARLQAHLIEGFSNRLDVLAMRFGYETQGFAKCDKAAIPGITSAGVLTLQKNSEGELCALLSKRVEHRWYDNFGGKSDVEDDELRDTAAREVSEESNGMLQYNLLEFEQAPFHDIVTQDAHGRRRLYRMYIIETNEPLDITQLTDREHTHHQWVPLTHILLALDGTALIEEEGQETIAIGEDEGNQIILFPPLYHMLRQQPVKSLLQAYSNGQPQSTHTQGMGDGYDAIETTLLKPITTPRLIKSDIIHTQLKKSQLLGELKQGFFNRSDNGGEGSSHRDDGAGPSRPRLSQSELHMKIVLGDEFDREVALEYNVRRFIDKKFKRLSNDEKVQLRQDVCEMIAYERAHLELVFFYHGANDVIAYAYAIYTAMYKLLAIEGSREFLRADNPLFHKCLNIQEFIAHFAQCSDDGDINNYSDGYMACGLSTNLFIFGNHSNSSSCTIDYYTNNVTSASIHLLQMFEASLLAMGVSDTLIARIANLAASSPYRGQGVLYQIGIPLEAVDDYAYTAGSFGRLNPLQINGESLTKITQVLDAVFNGDAPRSYVKNLQSRLMLPPDAPTYVRHKHWGASPSHQQVDAYYQQIYHLAKAIARDILSYQSPHNVLNAKLPLLRQTPLVMSHVGIMIDEGKVSNGLIIQLIESRDYESIKTIFERHPEYKEKPITIKSKAYINTGEKAENEKNGQRTILHLLLDSPDSGSCIRAIYGDDFYVDKLDQLDYIKVLNAIASKDQAAFAKRYGGYISDIDTLYQVLRLVPENERLDVANANENVITDGRLLGDVLDSLPEPVRLSFASNYQHRIRAACGLWFVLRALPIESRFEFAINHHNLVLDISDLVGIVTFIKSEDRMEFINSHLDLIKSGWDSTKDGRYVIKILNLLPEDQRFDFAITHLNEISNCKFIVAIINVLPEAYKIQFAEANQSSIVNIQQLSKVLVALGDPQSTAFYEKMIHLIKDGYDVITLLRSMRESMRFAFAIKLQYKIVSRHQLSMVLSLLQHQDCIEFIDRHLDKINDAEQVVEVLGVIPVDYRLVFANRHRINIKNGIGLARILEYLHPNERLTFATENQNRIQTGKGLFQVLEYLPESERFNMAIHKLECIHDGYQFAKVLSLLPLNEREVFLHEYAKQEFTVDNNQREEIMKQISSKKTLSPSPYTPAIRNLAEQIQKTDERNRYQYRP